MIRYRTRKISAVIPTASMADIAFLMITFFMYTTSFSVDRTTVNLPESVVRQLVEKDAAIIAVTDRGEIKISDGLRESAPVGSLAELETTVKEIVRDVPGRQFIIKCDKNAEYRVFNRIYEVLMENNVQNVALLTEKKEKAEVR